MSQTLKRDSATDSYKTLSSYDNTDAQTEESIVQALVKASLDVSANSITWNNVDLSDEYINTSAIFNYPSGTVTEHSAISVNLSQTTESFNSYSTNISSVGSSDNTYSFSSLNTSAPYYDSNYVVTQNIIKDAHDESNNVLFTFDLSNANVKIQNAMQSRWNTTRGPYVDGLATVGDDPLSVRQDISFNHDKAFGKMGSVVGDTIGNQYECYWSSVNANDGSIDFTKIDPSYQLVNNNIYVKDRETFSNRFSFNDDVGIFRLQKGDAIITTKINDQNIGANDLEHIPIFNENGGTITSNSTKTDASFNIPGDMIEREFKTLFNSVDSISDGWEFKIDISSNGGGYFISGLNDTFVTDLSNANIKDNLYYMKNYVNNTHHIDINNGTVTVAPDTHSISVDLTDGEILSSDKAGIDGQILIDIKDKTTRATDISGASTFTPYVYYESDVTVGDSKTFIDGESKTSKLFDVMWQKVAQNTETNPEENISQNEKATLSLFTDKLVNNLYTPNEDFTLDFKLTSSSLKDVNLWKVDLENNLIINGNSFYDDEEYVNVKDGIITSGTIRNVIQDSIYNNNYRLKLRAKTIDDISLKEYALNINCQLSYKNDGDTFLQTSSALAYATNDRLPVPKRLLREKLPVGIDISYSYTYNTVQSAETSGGLQDFVTVEYSPIDVSVLTPPEVDDFTGTFIIQENEIVRNLKSNETIIVDVSQNLYNIINTSTPQDYKLRKIEYIKKFDAKFDAKFASYTNLLIEMNDITQITTQYVLYHNTRGNVSSFYTKQYLALTEEGIAELGVSIFDDIRERVERDDGLRFEGVLTGDDLKPLLTIIQSSDAVDTWNDISDEIVTDVYYRLNNIGYINDADGNPNGGELTTINELELQPDNVSSINLTSGFFYTPFTIDNSAQISVHSFEENSADLKNGTNLESGSFNGNNNYLTVTNGYNAVTSWNNNTYYATHQKISTDSYSINVKKNSNNATVFSIKTNNSSIFLGNFIVSSIKGDVYRAKKSLDNTFSENFGVASYLNNEFNLAGINGVYVSHDAGIFPILNDTQQFKLITDSVSVALIGSADGNYKNLGSDDLNNGSLTFQDISGAEHSAKLTFPYYRGYNGNENQIYVVQRTNSSVDFIVDSTVQAYTRLTNRLTENMYHNENFTVNNLTDESNNMCADLNISSSFKYSILPNEHPTTHRVTVLGDLVILNITGENNVVTTLLNYGENNIYSFDGLWHTTNNNMLMRPSRVKLTNSNYPAPTLSYKFNFALADAILYKAINNDRYLGNPQLLDHQDSTRDPLPENWEYVNAYDETALKAGFDIGSKHLYLSSGVYSSLTLAYFVSLPPYYSYQQMSTYNTPTVPYDYTNDNVNLRIRYYPYTGFTTVFNPFASDLSYTDINGNTTSIDNDSMFLNNVTFTFEKNIRDLYDLFTSSNEERTYAIVRGTHVRIDLYDGLYPSTNNGSQNNPLYEGPITSMPDSADIANNAILFRERDDQGAISFSLLQYPMDIGFSNNSPEHYTNLLKTSNQHEWYNIDMKIGNSSWVDETSPTLFFDMASTGVRSTLYTVMDLNNPDTQTNYRRVYKYSSLSGYNVNSSPLNDVQTITLPFSGRKYYDKQISGASFSGLSNGIWNYQDILNGTDISASEISWTDDVSFNTTSYVGWSFGNAVTSQKMIEELLYVQDTQKKWSFITLDNFMTYKNQFGLNVGSIAWDGTATAPLVNTRTINLHPTIRTPNLEATNNSTIQQYSESTLSGNVFSS